MKFSFVFAVVAAVASVVAPVASAPVSPFVQERSSLEKRFSGRGTWFNVGLGACGKRNKDSQPIIAMNKPQWSNGKLCGKWLTIKANGKTARGYIEDLCPSCKKGALDLSPSLFKKFAPLSKGVITVNWSSPKKRAESKEGDLEIRAGTADDDDETDDDPEFQFDPADAVTDEELAELFGDDDGDDTAEETTTDS
ncbi:hypothetical protein FRC00_004889 [Tulasnella sp. 408]|nr:hypothetical protein FRC00_004889 [Tulasnella sp. 408]